MRGNIREYRSVIGNFALFIRTYYREFMLAVVYIMAAGGIFIGPGRSNFTVAVYFLILLFVSVSLWESWPENRSSFTRIFYSGLICCLVVSFVLQITGGIVSPFWPVYFILIPAFTFSSRKVEVAGSLLISVLFLESSNLLVAASFHPVRNKIFLLMVYSLLLTFSTLITGWLTHRSFGWAETIREKYEKLKDNARNLVELDIKSTDNKAGLLSQDFRRNHKVGSAMMLDVRLDSVLSLATIALGAEHCGLFLLDELGEKLTLRKLHPMNREPSTPVKVDLSGRFVGSVVRNSSPVILGSLDPGDARVTYLYKGHQVRSLAVAPVVSMEVVIGALFADSSTTDAFRGKKDILLGFAGQVAEILLASQRVAKKEEEGIKHQSMSSISNALSSSLKETDILNALLDETANLMGYKFGAYFMTGPREKITLKIIRGLSASLEGKSYSVSKSLLGLILSNRRPLLFDDLGEDRRKTTVVSGLDINCRSLVAVPVILKDDLKGIFLAADTRPALFNSGHLEFLKVLANQVAVLLSNAAMHEQMEQMAVTDGLTGLFNHRCFHDSLEKELLRIKRHPEPLSLIILDLDHFKKINDTYGHPFGDFVLKGVSSLLFSLAREVDIVARYGGEEMALLLVNTDRKGAASMAMRVIKGLRKKHFRHQGIDISVTASIGSSTYPDDGVTSADLIRAADEALYRSKREGRNRYTPAEVGDRVQS